MRTALHDAAPLYRDAPEAKEARAAAGRGMAAFLREALPDAPGAARALAGELVMTTLGAVGKRLSESDRTPADLSAHADAMADMFCAWLGQLQAAGAAAPGSRKRAPRKRA